MIDNVYADEKPRRKLRFSKPMNIPEKTCKICGIVFKPHCNGQRTCSPECSHQNKLNGMAKWREKNPNYYREIGQFKPRYKPSGRCKICGEIIVQEFTSPNHRGASQMHTECVLKDCRETIANFQRLSNAQVQRLVQRGYTITEFKEEFFNGNI